MIQEISDQDLIDKSQKEESPTVPFEEIIESREMIEDRIFTIKC